MSNSLAEVHPELVSEWSEKNLPLTPDDITFGSNKKVWWRQLISLMSVRGYGESESPSRDLPGGMP